MFADDRGEATAAGPLQIRLRMKILQWKVSRLEHVSSGLWKSTGHLPVRLASLSSGCAAAKTEKMENKELERAVEENGLSEMELSQCTPRALIIGIKESEDLPSTANEGFIMHVLLPQLSRISSEPCVIVGKADLWARLICGCVAANSLVLLRGYFIVL